MKKYIVYFTPNWAKCGRAGCICADCYLCPARAKCTTFWHCGDRRAVVDFAGLSVLIDAHASRRIWIFRIIESEGAENGISKL